MLILPTRRSGARCQSLPAYFPVAPYNETKKNSGGNFSPGIPAARSESIDGTKVSSTRAQPLRGRTRSGKQGRKIKGKGARAGRTKGGPRE